MRYTWIIHQICDKGRFTYHTHGLNEYGSLELELNLSLVPRQAGLFINLIAESIAKGNRYESGQCIPDIFTAPFYLLKTKPIYGIFPEKRVLRVIFSDPGFRFPWQENCDRNYRTQLLKNKNQRIENKIQQNGGDN